MQHKTEEMFARMKGEARRRVERARKRLLSATEDVKRQMERIERCVERGEMASGVNYMTHNTVHLASGEYDEALHALYVVEDEEKRFLEG